MHEITGETFNISAACDRLAILDIEIDRLKADLKTLSTERDLLEDGLVREIKNGSAFQGGKYHDRTISVATIRRPKPLRSRPHLVAALKVNGLGWLVKEDYNENTLYGHTNEWIRAATDGMGHAQKMAFDANALVPEGLREDLSLNTTLEIRVIKGK